MTAISWTREDDRRFNTHAIEVVATLTGGAAYEDQGNDRLFADTGGLSIDRRNGRGYVYSRGQGHPYTRVAVLEIWKGWGREEAVLWARAWLDNHPGEGSCVGTDDDAEDSGVYGSVSREKAEETLAAFQPAAGTPAEIWLRSRGLEPPYPDDVGFAEYRRTGEHAVVAKLRASDGTVTGVELRFVEPRGAKTTLKQDRVRYNLTSRKDAAFRLPAPAGAPDVTVDRILAEGFIDALTVAKLGRKAKIEGIPGCGFLRHAKAARGDKIVIFRDGDNDEAYIAGVNALVRQRAVVRVTGTPAGKDANDIHLESGYGALESLFIHAAPLPTGEIVRLAQLDALQAELEMDQTAKLAKVGISVLRKAIDMERRAQVRVTRKAAAEAEAAEKEAARKRTEDPEWTEAVDLAAALDTFVRITRNSVVAPEHYFDVAALWAAASYTPALEHLKLQVMPQLGLRSPQAIGENAGKSIFLEAVTTVAYRGELRSSYTPATIFRSIANEAKTFGLVDVHNHELRDPSELKQIINACHKRAEAKVDRCEKLEDGSQVVRTFERWAALAWTSIGGLPQEIQSRAIILDVRRATPAEFARLNKTLSPSQMPELVDVRRQLLAWSKSLKRLPKVPLDLSNRDFDNWRILYEVAELAGADWPQRVRAARQALAAAEKQVSDPVRLLQDIFEVFAGIPGGNAGKRIKTQDLAAKLTEDVEKGWCEANHGRPINAWWLRKSLFGLIAPDDNASWMEKDPKTGQRRHVRGLFRRQFDDAFSRYLSPYSISTGSTGENPTNPIDTEEEFPEPVDHSPGSAERGKKTQLVHPIVSENNDVTPVSPVEPVETPTAQGIKKHKRGDGNGQERSRRAPQAGQADLNMPPGPLPEYRPGSIAAAIQDLRASFPQRSTRWIAQQVGQPKSVVDAVLSGLKPDGAEEQAG